MPRTQLAAELIAEGEGHRTRSPCFRAGPRERGGRKRRSPKLTGIEKTAQLPARRVFLGGKEEKEEEEVSEMHTLF